MAVLMVQVGHMGVCMRQRFVLVPMAVSPLRHHLVHMGVVAIVVGMRVLMLKRLVGMLVRMKLHQVKSDTRQHQRPAHPQKS